MAADLSRVDMRSEEVANQSAPARARGPLVSEIDAAVDRRLARLWRGGVLVVLGIIGGAGGTFAASGPRQPPQTEAATMVCECAGQASVNECRMAADYMRAAATQAGVTDAALEQIAREILGAPPLPLSSQP